MSACAYLFTCTCYNTSKMKHMLKMIGMLDPYGGSIDTQKRCRLLK